MKRLNKYYIFNQLYGLILCTFYVLIYQSGMKWRKTFERPYQNPVPFHCYCGAGKDEKSPDIERHQSEDRRCPDKGGKRDCQVHCRTGACKSSA